MSHEREASNEREVTREGQGSLDIQRFQVREDEGSRQGPPVSKGRERSPTSNERELSREDPKGPRDSEVSRVSLVAAANRQGNTVCVYVYT